MAAGHGAVLDRDVALVRTPDRDRDRPHRIRLLDTARALDDEVGGDPVQKSGVDHLGLGSSLFAHDALSKRSPLREPGRAQSVRGSAGSVKDRGRLAAPRRRRGFAVMSWVYQWATSRFGASAGCRCRSSPCSPRREPAACPAPEEPHRSSSAAASADRPWRRPRPAASRRGRRSSA